MSAWLVQQQGWLREKQMSEKETELKDALKACFEALMELTACNADLLNSRVGKHLNKQCNDAFRMAAPLIRDK